MRIRSHKRFHKQFKKLPADRQKKVRRTVAVFAGNTSSPPAHLRFHALTGEWSGYHSISVGGDLRVHLRIHDDLIVLEAVGTHAQLYE